ncbi:hypothetical protein WM41_0304 [Corynebacterium simulans]|uniref:Uncharacterized protein n=1 Tax=Corynebacterium simulans TaxID=146827 RepID=A0ABR5VC13_9CORY|nr:hypothetical protein WM41_0304 [Corynebacterium simulans]
MLDDACAESSAKRVAGCGAEPWAQGVVLSDVCVSSGFIS